MSKEIKPDFSAISEAFAMATYPLKKAVGVISEAHHDAMEKMIAERTELSVTSFLRRVRK